MAELFVPYFSRCRSLYPPCYSPQLPYLQEVRPLFDPQNDFDQEFSHRKPETPSSRDQHHPHHPLPSDQVHWNFRRVGCVMVLGVLIIHFYFSYAYAETLRVGSAVAGVTTSCGAEFRGDWFGAGDKLGIQKVEKDSSSTMQDMMAKNSKLQKAVIVQIQSSVASNEVQMREEAKDITQSLDERVSSSASARVSKVEKCSNPVIFLEKQSCMFMKTTNKMTDINRETLVRATLPNFHLPIAAEILTYDSFCRLPRCKPERIIPPFPITPVERLNHVIDIRLVSSNIPLQLEEMYPAVHKLAELRQIEVLHTRVARHRQDRVEENILGRVLPISYWRELAGKDSVQESGCRLLVQVDSLDPTRSLMGVHKPTPTVNEAEVVERSIRTVESLLAHTFYVTVLTELKSIVQKRLKLGGVEAIIHGSPAVLSIPILQPYLKSLQLLMSFDTHTGNFLAHVPQYPTNLFSSEIQNCLITDQVQLEILVTELWYWITARRIEKTLQQLDRHMMFIKLQQLSSAVLVVEFMEKAERECEIQYIFYYLLTKPSSIKDDLVDESIVVEIPRALGMMECYPLLVAQEMSENYNGRRKLGVKVETPMKRIRFPAYVASPDNRIHFTSLVQELGKQGVSHTGSNMETNGVGLAIKIVQFLTVPGLPQKEETAFYDRRLSATIRPLSFWVVKWILCGSPIISTQSMGKPFYSPLKLDNLTDCEKTVTAFVGELNYLAQLHSVVREYAPYSRVVELVSIQSCNYRNIVLEHGPGQVYLTTITWNVVNSLLPDIRCVPLLNLISSIIKTHFNSFMIAMDSFRVEDRGVGLCIHMFKNMDRFGVFLKMDTLDLDKIDKYQVLHKLFASDGRGDLISCCDVEKNPGPVPERWGRISCQLQFIFFFLGKTFKSE